MEKTDIDGSKGAWVETEKGHLVWVGFDEIIITLVPCEDDLPTREHNACVQRMPVSYEQHIVDENLCDGKFRKSKAKGKRQRGFVVRKEIDPLQRIVPWFQACVRWLLDNKVCTRIDCDEPKNVYKKERRNIAAREARAQISAVAKSVLFGGGFDLVVSVGKSSQVLHCYTTEDITTFEGSLRKAIMETTKVKGLVEQQERELNPQVNEAINDDQEWWGNAMMGFMQEDDSNDGEKCDTSPDSEVKDAPTGGKFAHIAQLLRDDLRQNEDETRPVPAISTNSVLPAANPSITRKAGKPAVSPTVSLAAQNQLPDWRRRCPTTAKQRAAPITKGTSTAKTPQTAGQIILRQVQGSQGGSLPSRPKGNPWNLRKDSDELSEAIQAAKAASLEEAKELDPREWEENDPWRPQEAESQGISASASAPPTEAEVAARTASSRDWRPSLPASGPFREPDECRELHGQEDTSDVWRGGRWGEYREAPREEYSGNGWFTHADPWRGYHNWTPAGRGSSSSGWNADSEWGTSTWGERRQKTTSRSKAKGRPDNDASKSYY
eukprot:GEMP01029458.1.p1 GENE.GEMP01029458.1~~GEMP01029458.1.p1  ORF type:complete len:551 (+),score=122.82 GEMP01029458.1:155-1807(+)